MWLGNTTSGFARRSRLTPLLPSLSPKHTLRARQMSTLQTVVLDAKSKHSGTVIFLHGLGDTAYGWLPVMQSIQPKTPHLKYILPTAPMRSVTINAGMRMPAWYDISDLSERMSEDFEGLEETRKQIVEIIESEIRQGVPSHRILLGGFSQGGASALYIGYRLNKPLAGVLGLSCYLPNLATFSQAITAESKGTECLMCHGEDDMVVFHSWGLTSFEALTKAGVKAKFMSYPGLSHAASEEEIQDVQAYILKVLKPLGKL